jgi:hypothetical protein
MTNTWLLKGVTGMAGIIRGSRAAFLEAVPLLRFHASRRRWEYSNHLMIVRELWIQRSLAPQK